MPERRGQTIVAGISSNSIIGVLLAAGSSRRFGANKLLQPLANHVPVAVQAARQLLTAIPTSIAVVRPEDQELKAKLAALPIKVIDNPQHLAGMSSSLVCGVRATQDAAGWVIALADMPYIPVTVIHQVAQQIYFGAPIVAPTFKGQRGHPVGFASQLGPELLQLHGDNGARDIIARHESLLRRFAVDSAGILQDIDTAAEMGVGMPA
jgi:molybdenum cofactor cytidylyltransferase